MEPHEDKNKGDLSRRKFFQTAGITACALVSGGASILGFDFLRPRVLFELPTKFTLTRPDAIEVGSVITDEPHHVYVARSSHGFRALSSVCTHLGCITRYSPDEGIIACPCHGSKFALDGEVIAGPAPRPLPCLQLDLSPSGLIVVDTSIEVPQETVFKL